MGFEDILKENKERIWKEYKNYLPAHSKPTFWMDKISNYRKEDELFWKMVSDYPQRKGKYVRGALIVLSCEAMGGDSEKAVKTAAAMQASEDWILIHDDLEDGSLERRGAPALQKIYGTGQAVNAGDALHIIMWKMLRDNEKILGTEKTFAVMDEMERMLMRTVLGQAMEILWIEENRTDLEYEDVFFVIGGKTSYYTIAGPLRLGAIIAGATPTQLEALFEFGTLLGRCFQIRDDLLDLTSDFEGLKKQVGNDIYEGKRTLMLVHLLKNIQNKEREKLLSILKKKREQKTEEEVRWVIEQMKKNKSLQYCEDAAKKLADEAMNVFNEKCTFYREGPAKENLKQAIQFILTRKK